MFLSRLFSFLVYLKCRNVFHLNPGKNTFMLEGKGREEHVEINISLAQTFFFQFQYYGISPPFFVPSPRLHAIPFACVFKLFETVCVWKCMMRKYFFESGVDSATRRKCNAYATEKMVLFSNDYIFLFFSGIMLLWKLCMCLGISSERREKRISIRTRKVFFVSTSHENVCVCLLIYLK